MFSRTAGFRVFQTEIKATATVPALLPEVDVRPALVVLPAGAADAVLLCVLHQGLPICHVLCYTLAHEEYGLLSG